MSDITIPPETILKHVERLREGYWRSATETDVAAKERRQREREEGADIITALYAENKRLKVESIQMQAALGYAIMAEDERYILPLNPFKCGTCDASKHLRAENERLRAALDILQAAMTVKKPIPMAFKRAIIDARAALEETKHE